MLTPSFSIALGLAFVLLGGANVWLVLESWSRVTSVTASSRLLTLHRIGGYLFIALFAIMGFFMLARLRNGGGENSPAVALHLALAMLLSPLLFIKVLIARYYKNQHGLLLPIGLTIFVLAFVLIASTAGPYLSRDRRVSDLGREVMQARCSKCHNLDRVVGARKDARGWLATVERMRAMPGAGISEIDTQTIVSFLVAQNVPAGSPQDVTMEVGRALVDQRCGRCHTLDRVYKTVQTPEQWREIVTRMVGFAAGSAGALQPGEDRQIVEYLAATQTPAAATQRRAQADAAASSGRSLIASKAARPQPATRASQYDGKAVGFISCVLVAALMLMIRRPRTITPPPAIQRPPATRPANGPFLLQLVRITPQTQDSKTLRFSVHGDRRLDAMPGQFLTFSFLFDGRKETRCYSICSSPSRSGYVEITPKRVHGGCVSLFLNERASVGMTVEATGPFGQFCLNPTGDRSIVLVAAGSGITPMMAMLRYIDDLCLDIQATLLYCVRTEKDLMFHAELNELQARLKSFQYRVLLSQPEPEWTGARGHISREFIARAVPEAKGRQFFLCGPPPFMDAARGILTDLGVAREHIRQETFGGRGKTRDGQPSETGYTVRFARSGKTAAIPEGRTLLEVAGESGVDIPSACRQGQCGTCKTRLLEGNVRMTAEQGLDPESKSRGLVLTCVGHADGNVTLDA